MKELDLNNFPIIENTSGMLKYNPFKEFESLKNLGDISERIYGCANFIGGKPDKEYPYYSENANLRAFLNEFSSLSEVLKDHSIPEFNAIEITKTDYPIFHFLKLLRNINFHIQSIMGGKTSFQGQYVSRTTGEPWTDVMTIERYIITDCNVQLLKKSRDFKRYDEEQMILIIEWVDVAQRNHGINDVLEGALRQYCKLIKSTVASLRL